MVLNMIVRQGEDGGFSAEVPSIKGCESWAHDEDKVIDQTLDLVAYYMKMDQSYFAIDRMKKSKGVTEYKIIFNKK